MKLASRIGFAIAFALLPATGLRAQAPRAHVDQGDLVGISQNDVAAFLGIPYAAPPVGTNRWRAPQPSAPWEGVKGADKFAASCIQITSGNYGPYTHEYHVSPPFSEDCLYLNVWKPARVNRPLPVIFWIHGGGFVTGGSSAAIYDGAALARRGVVVVSINYRLGLLGFLAHPELTREAGNAPPSNFGLQDAVAALRWVKRNIAAFGGDPANVTIMGQSAGSIAVHDLTVSPLARGLFAKAIGQSGLPDGPRQQPLAQAEAAGVAFAAKKHAADLAALRAMTAEQLMNGTPVQGFAPTIDSVLLPENPASLYAAGRFSDVPMLVGFVGNEASLRFGPPIADEAAYRAFLTERFGAHADRFVSYYPATTAEEREAQVSTITREGNLASLDRWARRREKHGRAPVYAYLFSHVEPGPSAARFGAFHSSDIPYVFGTLDAGRERNFTETDRVIARAMGDYWVAFAKTGNPNGGGRPVWPKLDPRRPAILEIDQGPRVRPLLPADRMAAFRASE